MYETALGIGIAIGPLLGGELGAITWRGPFFGVTVLMAIALVATVVLVTAARRSPAQPDLDRRPDQGAAPPRAAHDGADRPLYNLGFFTVLAYAPFPLHLGAHELGYVFTGWGVLVAIFAIFGAPRLQARFGIARALYVNLALFAVDVLAIAVFTDSRTVLSSRSSWPGSSSA